MIIEKGIMTIVFILMVSISFAAFALLLFVGASEAVLSGFVFYFILGKKATHKFYGLKRSLNGN